MNIKKLILLALTTILSVSIFFSCDKIEEPFFKPVYTDRYVLTEFIADAQNIDQSIYNDFVALSEGNNFVIPMVVLSGDTSINGNSTAANQIVNYFSLNTTDSLSMINRSPSSSNYGISKNNWETRLESELNKEGEFNLEIDGQLNQVTSTYTGLFSVTSLNGFSSSISMSLYILEDSATINQIELMSLLRESQENMNIASEIKRGESIDGNFTVNLESYNTTQLFNLKVLAIVFDTNTKEVFQSNITAIGLSFSKTQKVLVEDFTGHKCGNCPKAHEELAILQNTYGSQIVPMALHVGYFARPSSTYPTDFRTPTGDAIETEFGVTITPIGMINRTGDDADKLIEYSAWDASIAQLITQIPKVGIALNAEIISGNIEANIYVKAFEQNDALLKVQAFVLESHIIDKQLDYGQDPQDIEDYEHEHVLRASINGIWGEDLTSIPFMADQIISKQYSYTLNSNWNAENLTLVVIVYNDLTKEILQVEETHLH